MKVKLSKNEATKTSQASKYKLKLFLETHKNKSLMDKPNYNGTLYIDMKEGREPLPLFIYSLAAQFNKNPSVVFEDSLRYLDSFKFQLDKLKMKGKI